MPICYYHYTRQSEDWHPPRPSQRLCRTTNFFIYENTTHKWGNTNIVSASSSYSFINGGQNNSIGLGGAGVFFSGIAGGQNNVIDDTCSSTSFAVIGGGFQNCICADTSHSSILGGSGNCIADSCASILGGTGNIVPAGLPNTHIVGSGITAVCANTMHIEGLWACGLPVYPAFYPYAPGTVFAAPIGGTPLSGCLLYIM